MEPFAIMPSSITEDLGYERSNLQCHRTAPRCAGSARTRPSDAESAVQTEFLNKAVDLILTTRPTTLAGCIAALRAVNGPYYPGDDVSIIRHRLENDCHKAANFLTVIADWFERLQVAQAA